MNIFDIGEINIHPMILLHPPGGEVPNHGTSVTPLVASEQKEAIAWRAPSCSCPICKLTQLLNNAILDLSESRIMHVDEHVGGVPSHVSSEVGISGSIFEGSEIDDFYERRPHDTLQHLSDRLVAFWMVEPRYTAWQHLGSTSAVALNMYEAHTGYLQPARCCISCCHAAVRHLGTAWQPEMADRQSRREVIPRELARAL